ncbi:MAG TPA: hypothetical protein VNJ53_01350 [Gaiellaceae bacterium]|nr:hypothetical protein [Gaiellaceae bacterium]
MTARVAVGALLVAAGGLWLLEALDVVDVSYRATVGLLLVGIGLVLVVLRGPRGVLVVLGVLIALAGVPALLADPDVFQGGIGEETASPATRAELEPYRLAVGKLTVDLTAEGLDLDGATVEASVGVGELLVLLPEDLDADLDAHVGIGHADALGETESGVDVDLAGLTGTSGSQEVTLELDVGVGNLRVRRG